MITSTAVMSYRQTKVSFSQNTDRMTPKMIAAALELDMRTKSQNGSIRTMRADDIIRSK